MIKTIIKELIIVLLLVIAIVLVLSIFLYDYIPTNKVVPKIEQYQVPNSIKEELELINDEINEEEKTKIVYEIDGTDLKNYEKSNDYQKGKVNPFSQSLTDDDLQTTTNNSTTNNSISNNTNNNDTSKNTTNSNSVGNYLPNTGTK